MRHLAKDFYQQGNFVRVITNRYPRILPRHEIIEGMSVTRLHFMLPDLKYLNRGRLDLFLAGLFYRFWTAYLLEKILHDFNPDVINSHYLNEQAEFVGNCISRASKPVPWVISLHGGDVDGEPFMSRKHLQRFRKLTQQANQLTACSQFLANKAIDLEPSIAGKIQVIHNGVDVDLFSKARAHAFSRPYIFAVGQLVSHKGFDLLIEAFALISKQYQDVNLVIAGDGPFRSELERRIQENQLEERVTLPGKVDAGQVASLMAGSLFVAMPSRREAFGIVALEGMAAGKPVLASPVGGLPEFLPCPP